MLLEEEQIMKQPSLVPVSQRREMMKTQTVFERRMKENFLRHSSFAFHIVGCSILLLVYIRRSNEVEESYRARVLFLCTDKLKQSEKRTR